MSETKGNDTPQQTSPLGALDFKRIIGAPLSACVSAQEEAAQATLEYINEVVFRRKDDDPDNLEPVTVTFYFESAGVVNRLTIPLLCIVPVPYLQIEQVNLTFQATVTESSMSDDRLQLKAKYSSPGDSGEESDVSKAEYQNRRCIDVNLCVTAADMPMGISKILEIFNNQLVEVRQEEPSQLPKPAPQPEPEPSPQPESQPAPQPQPAHRRNQKPRKCRRSTMCCCSPGSASRRSPSSSMWSTPIADAASGSRHRHSTIFSRAPSSPSPSRKPISWPKPLWMD